MSYRSRNIIQVFVFGILPGLSEMSLIRDLIVTLIGKLSNADMEKRRQLLISGKSFLHIMVAIWIVAGILVLGMLGMSVAFGFWPLAVGAAIALVFFALFTVVAKFLRKRIVEAFNPR